MKKPLDTPLKGYLSSIVAFITATAFGIIIFSAVSQHAVESLARTKLALNVSRQSTHFEEILDVNYQYLEGVAAQIGQDDTLISEKNKNMISAIQSTTAIDHVALIDLTGTAYYENGEVKDVSHRDYVRDGLAGKRFLSDPVQSIVDHETRVILGVPVYHQDTIIGIIGVSYDVAALNRMMFEDLFDGNGFSIIIDEEGNIITLDGSSEHQRIGSSDNFFDFYDQWNFKGSDSLQEIRNAFQDQSDGIVKLLQPDDLESSRYIAYAPLPFNNWMMCYVIPVSLAMESYQFVQNYELVLNGFFMLLVVVLVIRIALIHSRDRSELVRTAQIDGLTSLYNKQNTKPVIDTFLQHSRAGAQHAFLILDIDKFKEVNDNYGHAAGDKILQNVGAFLKNQFRDNDISGRIGGDEFVILMKDVYSKDAAVSRVQGMLENIRSIRQSAIDNHNITFSVGIAFSPDQGMRFDDLYRSADKALYQSKRGGRDSFTVYEKV